MKVYPEWVNRHRTKGTNIKKVGNSYYLYKRTSKRVPGKKNPQTYDRFIGVITPEGVKEGKMKKLSTADIEVFEYGFSYALARLCPEKWKIHIGDGWEDVLCEIIRAESPRSYLLREKPEKDTGRNINMARHSLEESLNASLSDLYPLKDIYLIVFENGEAVSKVYDSQQKLLDRLSITVGGECG